MSSHDGLAMGVSNVTDIRNWKPNFGPMLAMIVISWSWQACHDQPGLTMADRKHIDDRAVYKQGGCL